MRIFQLIHLIFLLGLVACSQGGAFDSKGTQQKGEVAEVSKNSDVVEEDEDDESPQLPQVVSGAFLTCAKLATPNGSVASCYANDENVDVSEWDLSAYYETSSSTGEMKAATPISKDWQRSWQIPTDAKGKVKIINNQPGEKTTELKELFYGELPESVFQSVGRGAKTELASVSPECSNSSNCFSSFPALQKHYQEKGLQNLVQRGVVLDVELDGGASDPIVIDGWTTDEDFHIVIGDSDSLGGNGSITEGHFLTREKEAGGAILTIKSDYTKVNGLRIKGVNGAAELVGVLVQAEGVVLNGLLVRDFTGMSQSSAIMVEGDGSSLKVIDSMFINLDHGVLRLGPWGCPTNFQNVGARIEGSLIKNVGVAGPTVFSSKSACNSVNWSLMVDKENSFDDINGSSIFRGDQIISIADFMNSNGLDLGMN